MLAIFYLLVAVVLGDALSRRFLSFASIGHRMAAALLTGLLVSTWATYGFAYLFESTGSPMMWGNVLFLSAAVTAIILLKWRPDLQLRGPMEFTRWDWAFMAAFLALAVWMMFSTFSADGDRLLIGNQQWSDFGSNVSIMQSFAAGHNFPTEYPHFSGDRIRYHFLFYFQAGNLSYLGLGPSAANNVLSVITLLSLLELITTLGAVLFASRAVGRLGALLFFFHGTLAYVPFLAKSSSISESLSKIWALNSFLSSGLPYRGEDWGVWSQVVFLNQRHFASSIAILLLAVIFVVMQYQKKLRETDPSGGQEVLADTEPPDADPTGVKPRWFERLMPFAFVGCILGLLPMWNGAVFAGAAAVLTVLLLVLPLKREMIVTGIVAGLIALPQVIYLKSGAKPVDYSLFHWGYTVEDPTFTNVVYYLWITFGFKWIVILAAMLWGNALQRKVAAAFTALLVMAFCFQFSEEVLANHKFLNMWLVGANLFVAYGLVKLWQMKLPNLVVNRITAALLFALIITGGIIDLAPVKNSYWVTVRAAGDPFVEWVKDNTAPRSVFLSYRYVNHGILMAGRRLFYGHPYYAWGAGYPTVERDKIYKQMLESRDPAEVFQLIRNNGISYVAIDDQLRRSDFVRNVNEGLFERYFPLVFYDKANSYDNLKVYKVPESEELPAVIESPDGESTIVKAAATAFEGGEGAGGGQFVKPKGIVADTSGNFYVADAGNARVQKFGPDGNFLMSIDGTAEIRLREPNGVAVDTAGRIYVTDAFLNRLIRFDRDGRLSGQWRGPEPGFYGPRDIEIGPNGHVYVIDQGRTRVVRFDPSSESFSAWGSRGGEQGQFIEPTGIEATDKYILVADLGNDRIQIFDLDGKFVRSWPVTVWEKFPWHYPDMVFDRPAERLYVSNGLRNEILEFDLDGNQMRSELKYGPAQLRNPASLDIAIFGGKRHLLTTNHQGNNVTAVPLFK